MSLSDFLAPVRDSIISFNNKEWHSQTIAGQLAIHKELEGVPDLTDIKVALIGIVEDRGALNNTGCKSAPDEIRHYLYPLYTGKWKNKIADLGNIYPGETLDDSHAALKSICTELLKKGITPIILGGSQDMTYANYRAYDSMEQSVNLVSIDARFNLGEHNQSLNSSNYLSHVILKKPHLLYNFSQIGYQTYFTNQHEIELMDRMYFDVHRLGHFRNNIQETEPILRDADLVSFNLSAIRHPDAPGNANSSPNGFTGEEACALSRYAGISDKVSSFGIYECNPSKDFNGQTAHLVAQMVWYFIEGFNARKGDYPIASKKDYKRFTVLMEEGDHELIFYKSHLSDRWWIEVPITEIGTFAKRTRHKLIPCSISDYKKACQNETPTRWWSAMKKNM